MVDAQCDELSNPAHFQPFIDIRQSKEQDLKQKITRHFEEWHKYLNKLELEYHEAVHQKFKKFDVNFEQEHTLLQMIKDEGMQWQEKVC